MAGYSPAFFFEKLFNKNDKLIRSVQIRIQDIPDGLSLILLKH